MQSVNIFLIAAVMLYLPLSNAFAADRTSVTVLPFSQKEGQQERWLGSAIADLLMQNLAEVNTVFVLDRESLQSYLRELEFQNSGFVDKENRQRLGRVARVDQVIGGHYTLSHSQQITVTLTSSETDSQRLVQLETLSGNLSDLNGLIEQLTLAYLDTQHQKPDQSALQKIRLDNDYSLPALEHFYRGLNHYDSGSPAEAFSEFYLSSRADSSYLKAKLWMGQALLALGRKEMAIALYRELYAAAPNRVESLDAQLKAAELLLEEKPDEALPLFRALLDEQPGTPHRLFAAMRLGQIYSAKGEWLHAFTAYAVVDHARAEVEEGLAKPLRERDNKNLKPASNTLATTKSSLYVPWEQALSLYRQAIQQMTILYAKMVEQGEATSLPAPPRGVLLASEDGATITYQHRPPRPSLFHEQLVGDNWRENFYVVIMPKGYRASAARVALQGKLLKQQSSHDFTIKLHEFPLPSDTTNSWLGALYGQSSELSRLNKNIPFYGKHLPMFAVQIVENHGKVYEWSVTPQLVVTETTGKSESVADNTSTHDTEGVLLAALPFQHHQSGQPQLMPQSTRRVLALASGPTDELSLIAAFKDPETQRSNLFVSNSQDGHSWDAFSRLSINAQTDDLAPSLVLAEDGSMHLFWLSNRRGVGWELWHSRRPYKSHLWSLGERVEVKSAPEPKKNKNHSATAESPAFAYSVIQDRRGRWLVAINKADHSEIELLLSHEGKQWERIASLTNQHEVSNLALGLDSTARYHLALFSKGELKLFHSADAREWRNDHYGPYPGMGNYSTGLYPTALHSDADGQMSLLFADTTIGVQYSRYRPESKIPASDLVKDANLLPFAATRYKKQYVLLALAREEGIEVRRYQTLHATDNPENSPRDILYREIETDSQGNQWQRIFARPRYILPDVTAVGVAANGRLWWGIETGVMTLFNNQFTMKDVARGFFNHHVTAIQPCGDSVAFAAGGYDKLNIGVGVTPISGEPQFSQTTLGGSEQSVTAMACLNGEIIIATSAGTLRKLEDPQWQVELPTSNRSDPVTALAVDPGLRQIWAGTQQGKLYKLDKGRSVKAVPSHSHAPVTALALTRRGQLWVANRGEGVTVLDTGRNRWHTPDKQPYGHIGGMVADPEKGVWITAGDSVQSQGLAHHDGKKLRWFNPPSRTLKAPTGISIAPDGSLWVGTSFHGLYQLKRGSL